MKKVEAALGLAAMALSASVVAFAAPAAKTITVDEVTNAQVAVSPDRKTLLVDVQGLIYSVPMSGGVGRRLTDPLQEASHPDWSSTGDLIALQCYAGGTFHIWTMRPDGSGLKQVTFGHGDDREPRISPDGKTIVFASDRAFEGSYDIWTVPITGGEPTRVTNAAADEFEPNWSPDGKKIVFVAGTGITATSILSVSATGGSTTELRKVSGPGHRFEAPSWSPDAKHLAYVEFEGSERAVNTGVLQIVAADGSGEAVTGKKEDVFPFPVVWTSPSEFVYSANGQVLKGSIGGPDTAVKFTAAIPYQPHGFVHKQRDYDSTAPRQALGIYAPALSPNGKSVAFVALNQLYLLRMADGAAPVALTHDSFYKQGPVWSPDGSKLAYVTDRDGIENVYLHAMADATDADDKPVAPQKTAQIMPAWSADGKTIAFQDQTGATLQADVATGSVKPLAAATFFPGRASFSPNGKTVAIATIKPYTKRFREGTSSILTVDRTTLTTKFYAPAPYESVTTRTEDGPIYSPNGKEMLFVMDDLLYVMPVDADGHPSGAATKLGDEIADAPTYSGDGKQVLYLSLGKLRLMDRASGKVQTVPLNLTWTPAVPKQKLLVHAGRFWKGRGADVQTDVDLLITDNRLTSVTPHSAAPPAGVTRVIDASHSTVMPGLWENHAHPDSDNGIYYGARMGRLYLAYGVTEMRGIADNAYRAVEHNESYKSGAAVGPRVFNTGEAIDGERVYYPMMIPTTSEAQLQREFVRLKGLDFDMMKLYVRLPYAWAAKGVAFAHAQMGVDTAGHYLLPEVALGEDGMSHVSATSRFGWAYSRSLTGHSYGDVRTLLAKSGMWVISTTFAQAQYTEDPGLVTDARQGLAPPWEHARLSTALKTAQAMNLEAAYTHLKDEESVVSQDFHDGGLVLAGTDSPLDIPATSLHLNLRAQVKYGMKPWEALETATSLPAKAYGYDKDLGTLESGKLADFIVVDGDPLTHIEDAAKVQCVAKGGQLWSVDEIAAPFAKVPKVGFCSSAK